MKIYVDTGQLRKKGEDIKRIRDELQFNMEQIESLVRSVSGVWQGDAERAYESRILYVKKEYAHMLSFFDDYVALLESFAARYEEYDHNLSAKLDLA